MSVARLLWPLLQFAATRSRQVSVDDLRRTKPLSRAFGLERGTPIDRYYIERFLSDHRQHMRGRLLEVAGDAYSRKFQPTATSYQILYLEPGHPDTTIVGDLAHVDALPEAVADTFICTQTINFIFDFASAIRGAYKLLGTGGILLATVPGISQISRYDMERWGDYWRFTDASARRAFGTCFELLDVCCYGNVLSAKAMLDGLAVSDLPDPQVLEPIDPDYQVLIGIVGRKRSAAEGRP